MGYVIRKKEINDCRACEKIITLSWQQTYKGIVNDEFLLSLKENEDERIEKSIQNFGDTNDFIDVLEVDNEVVGFVRCGLADNEDYGEIFALYITESCKKKGYGRKLFETAKQHLKFSGFNKMIIGCLEGNPSNDFYKHMGGKKLRKELL